MIGFKNFIIELKNILKNISVSPWVAMYNDQPRLEKEGAIPAYKKPAIFIEPILNEGTPIGGNATSYEVTIKLLVQHEHYNTEGTFDEDLLVFDLKDEIHRKLNGIKLDCCSPLYQSSKVIDTTHGNQYLGVLEYKTHYIDFVSTPYDEKTMGQKIEILTTPQIIFEDSVISNENYLLTEQGIVLATENNQYILA